MPLRTDRGRSAAMRGIWSWPLQSARHLVVTLVAAAAVATGVTVASAAVHEPAPTSQTPPVAAPAPPPPRPPALPRPAPTTSSAHPTPEKTTTAPQPATAPPAEVAAALTVARNFAAHWVRPPTGTKPQQWVDGLVPYVMPEYVRDLATVDPANIPASRLTGEPAATAIRASVIVAEVPTDAGTVRVTVVHQENGQWRVKNWDQA